MGTLRFFEEVVSFKIRRTFGFADYIGTNADRNHSAYGDAQNHLSLVVMK